MFRACAVCALRTSNASDIDLFIASREIRRSGWWCASGMCDWNGAQSSAGLSKHLSQFFGCCRSDQFNLSERYARRSVHSEPSFFQELCQQTPKEIKEANNAPLKSCRWSRASAKKKSDRRKAAFSEKMMAIFA